jgi:hypothetical protein
MAKTAKVFSNPEIGDFVAEERFHADQQNVLCKDCPKTHFNNFSNLEKIPRTGIWKQKSFEGKVFIFIFCLLIFSTNKK